MGLTEAIRHTMLYESALHYTQADDPLRQPDAPGGPDQPDESEYIYHDGGFWDMIASDPKRFWGKTFQTTMSATLSEWVPRVPGMYWHPDSRTYHDLASREVSALWGHAPAYTPAGKSMVVIGGTGTLKLPPDAQGRRLASLTMSRNASAGIPVLIAPEVWSHHKLREGALVSGRFTWRQMEHGWVQHFLGQQMLVRGYLEVTHPDQLEAGGEAPVMVHPFSIMDYEKDGRRYYDFMFFGMNQTSDRADLKRFLAGYAEQHGHARYLIETDVSEPLFDGRYSSPGDFRSNGREHLDFMERRMKEAVSGRSLQDVLYESLCNHYADSGELVRLSSQIQLPASLWQIDGSLTDLVVAFLNEVFQREKSQALIGLIRQEKPNALPV